MNYEGVAISGYGETEYHKKNPKGQLFYITESVRRAINSAGLKPDDIDGLAVTSFQLPPDNVTTVAENLGMKINWAFQGLYGGASPIIGVLDAIKAIQSGVAKAVVCVAADSFNVEDHMDAMGNFNGTVRDYMSPYGFGGPNGMFGLVQQRHMYEFGTTREQLGKLAVTQRQHASLNPNALLRDPMTMEDYLNARIIADPIRLYDCVMPCGGGGAVVITTEELAKNSSKSIKILSGGRNHNAKPNEVINLECGWVDYQQEMFSEAGVTHEDLDLIHLYDDYPIMELIQLEDLGFCKKGEGGSFIDNKDFSITGDLPLNTGGGQLSCGQSGAGGGIIGLVEVVRQLMHEGGERQVENARLGLASGFGMVTYGHGLSTSAIILSN